MTGSIKKDIVMIRECIGVKIAISDHRSMNMEKRDLVWLASQARQAGILSGKPGITHLHTGSGKAELDMLFDIVETTEIPIFNFRPTHLGGKFEAAMRWTETVSYTHLAALIKRKSKRGKPFYGCERYPECDFVSWDKPAKEKCPQCGSMMVNKVGQHGAYTMCTNKDCGFVVRPGKKGNEENSNEE